MSHFATLITGSNGGIGYYIADYLLKKGLRSVVCHYRSNNDRIAELLKKFDLDPDKHLIQAHLTNEESITRMADHLHDAFGGLDKLVNVAGSSTNAMSWKMSRSDFMNVIEDNLLSAFLCSKAFIPEMRERRFGRIINFSSIVATTGMPGASHYAAAKSGLVGLTKSLALELAPRGITVNAIALGYFNAGLIKSVPSDIQAEIKKKIPMGRFGDEHDIGALVHYLLSEDSYFMTGQTLHLNGGQS